VNFIYAEIDMPIFQVLEHLLP